MRSLRLVALLPLALIGACGNDRAAEPGGLSAREAQELNEAAEMLDADAVGANVLAPAENAQ